MHAVARVTMRRRRRRHCARGADSRVASSTGHEQLRPARRAPRCSTGYINRALNSMLRRNEDSCGRRPSCMVPSILARQFSWHCRRTPSACAGDAHCAAAAAAATGGQEGRGVRSSARLATTSAAPSRGSNEWSGFCSVAAPRQRGVHNSAAWPRFRAASPASDPARDACTGFARRSVRRSADDDAALARCGSTSERPRRASRRRRGDGAARRVALPRVRLEGSRAR